MPDDQPVFGDRYQIVRHIARGGMAQVYLARDLLLDRPVALKVLFPELSVDEAFVERFRREAQAAANLSHPNIVSIYDWGQGDLTYYIVMEYVDGETLSARIRRAPLSADQAAGIAMATASALAFAHQRNVIHRDVKPGNVLIDQSGQVKVADFGIARAVGAAENLTQAGAVMGTATYFSPEQAQGFAVDARSDVYSLGVVLFEMVIGKPPFQGENPVSIAYKHVREEPPAPRTLNPSVPAAYEAIVLQALAKDPADRYQTADELRADLERFRGGRRILAGRAGAGATVAMAGATSVMGAGAADATRVTSAAAPTTVGRRPVRATIPPNGDDDDTGPIVTDGTSRTGLYVALIVLLVAALAVLGWFIGRDLGLFGGSTTLTVPKVAQLQAATAEQRLQSAGFTHVTEKKVTSATVKVGDAVTTVPGAGSKEKGASPITLEVSAGAATTPLPNVDGRSKAAAEAVLRAHGFTYAATTQTSDTVPAGSVIRTDPPEGQAVAPHIKVGIVVSTGRKQVRIPISANQSPVTVATALSGLGFKVTPQTQSSATVPIGEVIGTSPGAGQLEPVGSTVIIYTSSGPAMVDVPRLTGLTRSAAGAALTNLGLKPVFTTTPVTSVGQDDLVQGATSPPAGTPVRTGTSVGVVIGSYTVPSTTSTSTTTSTTSTTLPASTTTTPSTTPGPGAQTRTAVP